MMYRTGFIGAGKVGTAFGRYLKTRGLDLEGYWSRTLAHAKEAAEYTGSRCYDDLRALTEDCDLIFITVSDGAIEDVARKAASLDINLEGKCFCHTSGALSSDDVLNPLKQRGAEVASAHMLLAVSGRDCDFTRAFFTVEGDFEKPAEILKACGNRYKTIAPRQKVRYHAAAVFASNFAVGLVDIACELLENCGFTEREALDALTPLMENNMKNITEKGPQKALTGPVARNDTDTIRRHMECLETEPFKREVYGVMTKVLLEMKEKTSPRE